MASKPAASAADIIKRLPQRYDPNFPVHQLEDFPGNPKDHDIGAISESIDANGWYGVLLVQDWKGVPKYILAGHGRRTTLIAKGVDHVPVILLQCDPKTARRIVLADNRTSELGGFNLPKLAEFLTAEAESKNLRGTGYDGDDVDDVIQRLSDYQESLGTGDEGGDPTEPEAPKQPEVDRFQVYPQGNVMSEAFDYFRALGFPYRKLPLHVQMQEINALAAITDERALRSTRGYAVADTYHPHRYHAAAAGMRSPFDSFMSDKSLQRAIRFEIEEGSGSIGDKMFGAMALVHGTQACANFRPGYAMHLYRKFCQPGAAVLDPCLGYGGRLVGWIAANLGGTYSGCDPNEPTLMGNRALAEALAPVGSTLLMQLPFEEWAPRAAEASMDFAFTSPPYFAKELYSDDPTQSHIKFPTIEEWRVGFLAALMRGCFRLLKPGARLLINVADIDIGSEHFALEEMTVEEAKAAGFDSEDRLSFPVPQRAGQDEDHKEPVFIFRKPQD